MTQESPSTQSLWPPQGAPIVPVPAPLVVPVVVFTMAGLWTYLTYFAVLFPVHFLAYGAAAHRLKPAATWGITLALAAGNVVFMLDYYRFVERNGGAQGSAGTALGT